MCNVKKRSNWPRRLAVWMNRLGDAWNDGACTAVFVNGRAVAPGLWSRVCDETGDPDAATDAVEKFAISVLPL